ncbi:ubiquitin carboxyl-terminal hydrolase 43 [Falco peregrinus]|uniref:ubiquitin carboxyl-terminal hydrolase 43 n=1 Tax=Falco peregrinus TaxID=8954 RepID=UPI002478428F|nr:ubiquitin carboxyl-terminal hydrolase 43 [Falco peregrinus]
MDSSVLVPAGARTQAGLGSCAGEEEPSPGLNVGDKSLGNSVYSEIAKKGHSTDILLEIAGRGAGGGGGRCARWAAWPGGCSAPGRAWPGAAGGAAPPRRTTRGGSGAGGGGGGERRRRRPGGAAPGGGGERPPGAQGLRNHGNTCFMNAVVQCLSNTAPLAEFLALGRYRARGARAEVTHRLAALVRALWTRDYTPQLSAEFKNIVSKHSSQFRGNAQHDALEFLLWLLDRMHEDLGAASPALQARVPEEPGEDGGSDAGSPSPAAQHPGGQSFVQSHFQAQYRSSLTCPHCLKQSNTFDPFLCISLPIPLRQTRALNVTLVLQCERWRFVRVGLAVPLLGTVAQLREMVAREGCIPPEQVILAEVSPRGFLRSLGDTEELGAAGQGAPLYAFQPPPARRAGCPRSLPASPGTPQPEGQRLAPAAARSSDCLHRGAAGRILLLLCNTAGTGPQLARFGPPLVLREERGVSWEQLQHSILAQLRALLRGELRAQGTGALFRIRLAGGSPPCAYLSPQDPRPLCHPAVDRALQLSGAGGPPHVKLTVEWDMSTKERLFGNIQEEVVQDAESVRLQQQAHRQQHSCTLDECFQLYTKEEQLAPDDAWRCPHCKVPQQGTVKLSLWTLPDILIIHLKRFRQVAEHRHKLTTLVRFPLRGLDMAPHVAQRGQASGQLLGRWAPWQPPLCLPPSCPRDYLYDLYAVCNHHGSMQGGHYTAYCCNALDGQWYSYDDSRVEGVQEAEVSTRSAYILFYQRRNAVPAWSAGSSVRGSTASSLSDHWLARLGGSTRATTAPCPPATPPSPPGTPDAPAAPEKGGFDARPLVRGVQGRSLSVKLSPASAPRAIPPRWSFACKERGPLGGPGGLVAYLESGRRPRCTRRSLLPLGTGGESGPDTPPAPSPAPASPPKQPGKGQEEPGTPRAPRQPLRVPMLRRAASAGAEGSLRLPPKSQSSPGRSGEGPGGAAPHWAATTGGGCGCPPSPAVPQPGGHGTLAELGQPAPAPRGGPAALGLPGQGRRGAPPAHPGSPWSHTAAGTAAGGVPAPPGRA